MTEIQPLNDHLTWLGEDDLDELNEEWIDKPSPRSNDFVYDEDTGTVNRKNTYDSIVIHENNDNATTKLNQGVRKENTPKWKKAIQQNPKLNSKSEESSTWNNFFESPSLHDNKPIGGSYPMATGNTQESSRSSRSSIPSTLEMVGSDNTSKSRLKVFQKHDTYTNSRLENLLGVLNLNSSQAPIPTRPESVQLTYTDSVSNSSFHRTVNSDSDLSSLRNQEFRPVEWNSADRRDITTQDFMDNADSLMKKLMVSVPAPPDDISLGDQEIINHTDSFESVRSSSRDPSYELEEDDLESLAPNSVQSRDPIASNRHSSVIVHTQTVQNGYDPSKINPANPNTNKRNNIAVIKPEDVNDIIPTTIGSMNYDLKNRIWRKKGASNSLELGEGSASAAGNVTDEQDIFNGIEDLSDRSIHILSSRSNNTNQLEEESHNSKNFQNYRPAQRPQEYNTAQSGTQNGADPDITGEKSEDNLQQKLRSIKSCLIETPRSAHVSGAFDKEVTFILPDLQARSIVARVGMVKPNSGDVTNISQIDSSFSHSMSQLVKAFTDKYPNQLLWDKLESIDISGTLLESLARLDVICPSLKTLNASRNNLSVVQGVPVSVTDFNVSNNKLTNLSNFGGLRNIQYLNISNNNIGSFTCLSHLIHLRELNANGCAISNLKGLSSIDGLLRLSIQENQLTELDGHDFHPPLLQILNVSSNKIQYARNLDLFKSLRSLDIDHNKLEELSIGNKSTSLTRICARNNNLCCVNISSVILKVLYLDNNPKLKIENFEMLKYLDAFSMDFFLNDSIAQNDISSLCDVENLKLVGNGSITTFPIGEPFLNLHKLDLAGLGLEQLPKNFGHYALNLRELNLAFNNISDLTPLQAIPKLGQVFLYKNNVDSITECLNFIKSSEYLQLIDLRENPLTIGFYADVGSKLRDWLTLNETNACKKTPLNWYIQSLSKAFQDYWVESDMKHARNMESYYSERFNKRVGYQGLLVSAGLSLKWLDGTILTSERVVSIKKHWAFILDSTKSSRGRA